MSCFGVTHTQASTACQRVVHCVLAFALLWTNARAQYANDGFDPNADQPVRALAVQTDGQILVAGNFTSIGGGAHTYLARLLADGTADPGFTNNVLDGSVLSLTVQADGCIVIGGSFTHVGAFARNHIARLNADGSVDGTFDSDANGSVLALAVQADGKILLGGYFSSLAGGATARNFVARLNADGSVDSTFNPDANNLVDALAVQADGKILLGGFFTSLGSAPATTRNYIARLNADGSLDNTFNPNADNSVYAFAIQADGKVLLAGNFTNLNGGATLRYRIARLNTDGSVDNAFDPKANSSVNALMVQSDGKVLLGGTFTTLNGGATLRNHIARLNADGSLDAAFNPDANAYLDALAVQADGKILLGGGFTSLGSASTTRNRIARLNADGSLDRTLNPDPNSAVAALAVQADSKILLAGNFTSVDGVMHDHIARLNADGSLDSTFNPDANDLVDALAVQVDGKILLGGNFTTLGNGATTTTRNHIARVHADGSVDSTFNPDANDFVDALAVQADGKILLGGGFTTLNGGSTARRHIARLNADGSIDGTFNPDANSTVLALAVQADGKILLGGFFTSLGSAPATQHIYIARLNADGSIDSTFDQNANSYVYALALQPDGKILLSGLFNNLFTSAAGVTRNHIARLNADGSVDSRFDPNADNSISALAVQADGKILLGGSFTSLGSAPATTRNRIARLNGDGSLDGAFDPDANGALVAAFAVQEDGKVLLGGGFTSLNGSATVRNHIARLSTPDASLQSLTLNGSTVTWGRGGAGPELALPPTLEFSLDGTTYVPAGTLSRIPGGWRGGGVTQPVGQMFYLRVRVAVSSGQGNGSQGQIETVRQFFGDDRIFADGFDLTN